MFPPSEGSLGSQSNATTATWAVKQQKVQSLKQSHPSGNDKRHREGGERKKTCSSSYRNDSGIAMRGRSWRTLPAPAQVPEHPRCDTAIHGARIDLLSQVSAVPSRPANITRVNEVLYRCLSHPPWRGSAPLGAASLRWANEAHQPSAHSASTVCTQPNVWARRVRPVTAGRRSV